MRLHYVSIHDANISFLAEAVFIGTGVYFRLLQTIYNESVLIITGDVIILFLAVFFGYNQYWLDVFMVFMSRSTCPVSTINRATISLLAKRHPNGISLLQRARIVVRDLIMAGRRLNQQWF